MYQWSIPPHEQVIALTLPYGSAMASLGEALRQTMQTQPDMLHALDHGYPVNWVQMQGGAVYYVATPDPAAVVPLLETLCGLHQLEFLDEAPQITVIGTGWQTLAQPTRQIGRYVKQNSEPSHFAIVTLHFVPMPLSRAITLDIEPLSTLPAWRDLPDRQQYEDQMFACLLHWALGGVPETLVAGLQVTAEVAYFHEVDSSLRDFYMATRLACNQALQTVGLVPAFP